MRCVALAFLFAFIPTAPALACECGPPSHSSSYVKQASIVFVGKVVFSDDDGSGTFLQKTIVHFKVEEAFKGLGSEIRDVWIDPGSFTSCYAGYIVGERYLVFGYGDGSQPKDSPAVSTDRGKSKNKPLPPGIDPHNPPKIYSAAECSGTRIISPENKDAISQELDYLTRYKKKILGSSQ